MEKRQIAKRWLSLVLALIMILGIMPFNVFAETYKVTEKAIVDGKEQNVPVTRTTDWSLKEENLKDKNFWPLAPKQYQDEVSSVAEPMKNPLIGYGGYFVRPDGRTVIRLTLRKFDKVGTGVWHVMHMKLEDEFFDKVDWNDKETGIYKGVSKGSTTGWYHDDKDYNEITPFGDTAFNDSGSINVKEVNIANNGNTGSSAATNEVPINLVLKEGQNINSFNKEPLVQIRMLSKNKLRVATYTDAGTGKGNYSTYTFSSIVPLKHNYEQNSLREIRESVTTDRAFRASGSTVMYNKDKGYIEVRHTYNKVAVTANKIYGRNLGYRQTVDKKFYDVLKPIDANGTIAHIYSTSNDGLPTSTGTNRLDSQGNPTADGSVAVLQRNINFPEGSNLGFIQIANTHFYTEGESEQGIKTNLTTNKPLNSWLDGVESLLNNGQGTTVRYYVDTEKVDNLLKENDGLQYFPFFSSIIMDNEKGQYKYTFKLDEDINLNAGDKINIDFANRYGKGDSNAAGYAGLRVMEMRIGIRGDGTEMFLGTNFSHEGPYSVLNSENGKHYAYTMQNGMNMNLKKGTEIYLFANYPDGGDLEISFGNNQKKYKASYELVHDPIVFDWQAAYSAGTIATTFQKPDVDEIFLEDKNITGRTYYDKAEINIKKSKADQEFQTIIAKPGNKNNKDDSRIDVVVNNIKSKGYEFDTDVPGEQKTFIMPELTRDMPLLFTNSDVEKLASESRPPVVEQVQAKVNFDLSGEKSKNNKDIIEKIAPLSKEYSLDIEDGKPNEKYKPSGFNGDNIKVDTNKPTVTVTELIDGKKVERTFNNVLNHDGLPYDIENEDEAIANKEKAELKLRQMPEKDDIKVPQGKRLLGWTTKKLEDTTDNKGNKITVVEQFNKLKEDKKIIEKVTDWASVDNPENPEVFIFDENSPIDKNRTVYAVYGEGINLILHSNNTTNEEDETTILVPITISDIDKTDKILDATSSATLNKMKGKLVIKELPKVPMTGEQEEIDKFKGQKARLFNIPNYSFIGWTTKKYTNDDNSGFAAGNNNERIGEITKGLVSKGIKRIPQKTECLQDLNNVQNKMYIPNGYSVAIQSKDISREFLDEELKKAIEEGKDIDLYANYRPFFDINVVASYKNIDKNQGDIGEYVDTVETQKKHATNIGLLKRTAVTPYGEPTVHQNANYYPVKNGIQAWDGSEKTLTWKLPGFDELGQRLSYVSVVVPDDKIDAYKNFEVPNWSTLGVKTYLRVNGIDGVTTQDLSAPKNLHKNAGNPYGDPVAKSQVFNEGVDTYTSATSRKARTVDRQGTEEVVAYTIWNTSTPLDIPQPQFDDVMETDKTAKLKWNDAEKNANIVKIKLKVADGEEVTLTKQNDGSYKDSNGLTAKVENGKLVIGQLNLTDKGGQDIVAKYVFENSGQETEGTEGRTTIMQKPYSAPVDRMNQGKNKNGKPVVEFDIPNPTLNKPKAGTEYVAQKWDGSKWIDVDPNSKYTMVDGDNLGETKTIELPDSVKNGDIIRIISKQPNSLETASTQTMDQLGNVTGEFDSNITPKSVKNRNYVELDRNAPELSNIKAKDEAFRRFIDLSATINEIPEGRKVTVNVKYSESDQFNKTFEIKKNNDKNYAIEYLNTILRKGVEEGSIPTITITAIDDYGNKSETNVTEKYKPELQLQVEVKGYRAGKKFIKVTADRPNSTITVKVIKSDGSEQTETATVTTAGEFVKVNFTNYKLQSGDQLDIRGICNEGGKEYTTNPFVLDIQ